MELASKVISFCEKLFSCSFHKDLLDLGAKVLENGRKMKGENMSCENKKVNSDSGF